MSVMFKVKFLKITNETIDNEISESNDKKDNNKEYE